MRPAQVKWTGLSVFRETSVKTKIKSEIEQVPIGDLHPDAGNPRKISADEMEALAERSQVARRRLRLTTGD